ncbi:class I SAM-dependent methyltransferase [Patescibacteria group bacterium]|nr:class I SAM-dependent methyltransferase [Patescibacteria group bacterium]
MVSSDFKSFCQRFIRGDNWHNLDVKRKNLGYGWFHYGMICSARPKRVLCIGSKWGFVPAVCAMACVDCGDGSVDFVDASYDAQNDGPQAWGGAGNWSKIDVKKYFAPWEKKINLHVMTTKEFCQRDSHIFDYIYIDGDHSYEGVKSDFLLLWPKLSEGGFILFHDINSKYEGVHYGTGIFWQKLKAWLGNNIELPGDFGVGIIQKKADFRSAIIYELIKLFW